MQTQREADISTQAIELANLLEEYGVPGFFGDVEKLLIQMFVGVGKHFPTFAVPKMIGQMRSSSRAIIPSEKKELRAHLHRRREQNIRMNINHLGEAVLGEEETATRMASYLRDMEAPERIQNRNTEVFDPSLSSYYQKNFKNEPDTDWSLAANRKWAKNIRNIWRKSTNDAPIQVPIVIDGKDIFLLSQNSVGFFNFSWLQGVVSNILSR